MNAIADTVQGKEYDSPPYTVVATYEDGSNSVSTTIHYMMAEPQSDAKNGNTCNK